MEEGNSTQGLKNKMLNSVNLFANRIDEVNEENNSELMIEAHNQNQLVDCIPQGSNTKLSADIITISIEIDENRKEILRIKQGDNLEKITSEFCEKHQLDSDHKIFLNEQIKSNIVNLYGNNFLINSEPEKSANTENIILNTKISKNIKQRLEMNTKKFDLYANKKLKEDLTRKDIKELFPEILITHKIESRKPQISKQSDKIVKEKGLTKVNVFTRLQQPKKEKTSIDEISQQELLQEGFKKSHKYTKSMVELNVKGKSSKENNCSRNIMLYNKGMVTLKEREKKISKAKKEQEFKELSQASFCPQININSEYYIKSSQRLENELLNIHKSLEMKRKRKLNEEENSNAKFKPKILTKSIKIDRSISKGRPQSQNRYETLYINAEERSQRLESKRANLTLGSFKPLMYPYNKKILESPTIVPKIVRAKSERKRNIRKEDNREIENYTFIPKICRGPKSKNKESPLVVEERLTAYGKTKDEKLKKQIMNDALNAKTLIHSNFIDPNSQKLIDKKKNEKFIEIFNFLDTDQDGTISFQNSDISQFNENVRKLISPIIKIMEETNAKYQKNEFIKEILMHYDTLPIVDKNAILFNDMNDSISIFDNHSYQKSQTETKIGLFQKTLNHPNSKLEDVLFKNKVQTLKKLHKMKEEEDIKLYQDCTFHPKITSIKIPKNTIENEYIFEDSNKNE